MTSSTSSFVIAIDGPAASGKGTLARKLAAELDFHHLDTGLTYRAVAHQLLQENNPLDDEKLAVEAARAVDLGALDRGRFSDHGVGAAASKVAVMPRVRSTLVELQRAFAQRTPGTVLDGRDIGTVVCPDAAVKLFVTASPNERARRRWNELQLKGEDADFDTILKDIQERDARDMARADSPLKPADDAVLLDTSEMDIAAAFRAAMDTVEKRRG